MIEGVICIDEGWAEIFHCLGGVLAVWYEIDARGWAAEFACCESGKGLVLTGWGIGGEGDSTYAA